VNVKADGTSYVADLLDKPGAIGDFGNLGHDHSAPGEEKHVRTMEECCGGSRLRRFRDENGGKA